MRLTAPQAASLCRLPLDGLGFAEPLPLMTVVTGCSAPATAAVRVTGSRDTGAKEDRKRQEQHAHFRVGTPRPGESTGPAQGLGGSGCLGTGVDHCNPHVQ